MFVVGRRCEKQTVGREYVLPAARDEARVLGSSITGKGIEPEPLGSWKARLRAGQGQKGALEGGTYLELQNRDEIAKEKDGGEGGEEDGRFGLDDGDGS
jgi:hypothetical protein